MRFLAVGGFNTAFGFLIFVLADLSVGRAIRESGSAVWASIASLLISQIVASFHRKPAEPAEPAEPDPAAEI